jgi:uncharacterized pyridoxal phosphate-containing UPF0001 family protein
MGITSKLSDEGFGEEDIDRLVELTQKTPSLSLLLSMAPVKADIATIRRIFSNSMQPMNKEFLQNQSISMTSPDPPSGFLIPA